MLKVGLTGGIGSGKSTVARIFEILGIPVYYADDRARALMQEDPALVSAIKNLLGSSAYHPDGTIDRKYIASRVFKDTDLLKALEAIVHPAVGRDAEEWHHRQQAPYTIREAALLFENGSYRQLDVMITVYAPKEIRIRRVMERDGISRELVLDRLGKQMLDEEKIKLADHTIYNDGQHSLIEQVMQIHQELIKQSNI
jgi:dephospho-CoA kinase